MTTNPTPGFRQGVEAAAKVADHLRDRMLEIADALRALPTPPASFPYTRTFNAIADAVNVDAAGHIHISVERFEKAYGVHPPAQPAGDVEQVVATQIALSLTLKIAKNWTVSLEDRRIVTDWLIGAIAAALRTANEGRFATGDGKEKS